MQMKIMTYGMVLVLTQMATSHGEMLELFTNTRNDGDSNWDVWQQDQGASVQEDAIYLGMFDGASGHTDDQPEYPTDGQIDGCYSTMAMGPGGLLVHQSLGVSGTSPIEFPDNQRDTRMCALFNLTKLMAMNSNPDDIDVCTFKWSVDYVMPWAASTGYLQAPTTLYISIFPADKQEYWRVTVDGAERPNTPITDLQDEFDPNGEGILYAEKIVDLRVDNGPWGAGTQPLTNWYIEQHGVQFYEVDITADVKNLIAADPAKYADPNTAFVGVMIRASLDGESVYLSMDARDRLAQNPIPPTLALDVTTYQGDFTADGSVSLPDWAVLQNAWLSVPGDDNWNEACNLVDAGDSENKIDTEDLVIFCGYWLDGSDTP